MSSSRLASAVALALGCLAGLTLVNVAPADAAEFTTTPGATVFTSGVGPFDWLFQSSENANGEMGWTAYKLSTETTWHRCLEFGSASLSNLPDGTYSIEIADDLNVNWLNSAIASYGADLGHPRNNVAQSTSVRPSGRVSSGFAAFGKSGTMWP